MDLSVVYSKTPKGLRARASLIGGLSSHLMKVLTHVDGAAKAETILLKFDNLTPQQLSADLTKLMQEGYIRLATVTASSDGGWALTTNFAPMVVEEYQSEEELEATTQAKVQEHARIEVEQQQKQEQVAAKLAHEERLAAEQKANKKVQKLRAKEKSKAETKVKAQLAEEQRIALAAKVAAQVEIDAKLVAETAKEIAQKKIEAEAKLLDEQAKIKAQIETERMAKLAEEAKQKAELKAREVAEQAQVEAEQKAKESARREIDRIAKEAEEAQRKQALEVKAKLEVEQLKAQRVAEDETKAVAKAEQARLQVEQEKIEAQHKAAEEAEKAKINAETVAKVEAAAKQKEKLALEEKAQAKENARLEIANIVRKAEEDRKQAVAKVKEEKLEAKRAAKAEQEAQIKAEKKLKEAAKEQAKREKETAEKARFEAAQLAEETKQIQKKQAEKLRIAALETAKLEAENEAAALLKLTQIDSAQIDLDQVSQEQINQGQVNHGQVNQEQQEYKSKQASEIIRAKADAEELATLAAKENARLEMERIGREAEVVRQKQQTEQHQAEQRQAVQNQPAHQAEFKKSLPILDDFDATEAAEEAAFEAEEQAAEAEKVVARTIDKTTQQAKEDAGRAQIKQTAETEAAQRGLLQANVRRHVLPKYIKKLTATFTKLTLIYLPVMVFLVIALLHFVNISMLKKPIEQLAANIVGVPVTINKVRASVWPQPHLVLEDVTVGPDSVNQKINEIHVLPVVTSLFDDVKIVKSLVIEGINIRQAHFSQALTYIDKVASAKDLKIEQVNLKNLTLTIQDLQLEPFDGKLIFSESQTLQHIDLVSSSNGLSLVISPQVGNYDISLKAANWALPFSPKIVFNALSAKGIASQNHIEFSQITGEVYGGNLIAKTVVYWPDTQNNNQWSASGSFSLAKVDTPLLLTAFSSAVSIDGKLNLNGSFAGKSNTANRLAQALNMTANFNVSQGSIGDIELARAVIARGSQSLVGDATNFDRLTGNVKINQGQYQYSKLVLTSPQFNAGGNLNIGVNEEVSGKIYADLAAQSRRLQANFALSGRGKDLKSN